MTFVIKSHESASQSPRPGKLFARQGGKISTAPLPPRPFKSRTSEATTIKEQKAKEKERRGALRDTGRRGGQKGK